jgi:hypothetical protein
MVTKPKPESGNTEEPRPSNVISIATGTPMSPADLVAAAFANPSQVASAVFDEGPLEREKLRLIGVPHIVTRIVYHSDFKFPRGYATFHGIVAPEPLLEEAVKRGWIPDVSTVSELLFNPGESIKYNDGSTGLRRQATMILHNMGVIDIGDVTEDASFDRSWEEWKSFSQTSQENDKSGGKIDVPDISLANNGSPLVILVRHGLRASFMAEYGTNVFYFS